MDLSNITQAMHQYTNGKAYPYINQGAKLLFKGVAAYCMFKSTASKKALYSAVVFTVSSEMKSQACSFLANKIYTQLNLNADYKEAVTLIGTPVQSFIEQVRVQMPKKIQKFLRITNEGLQKMVIAQALLVPLSLISKMVLSRLGIYISLRMEVETMILNRILIPFLRCLCRS